jgi:hypothetical protein
MGRIKNSLYQLTFDENGTITEFTGTIEKVRSKVKKIVKLYAYSYYGDAIEEGMRKTEALEMFQENLEDETSGDVNEEAEVCETGNFTYTIKKV